MDFKKACQVALQELEKRENEVAQEKQRILDKSTELDKREKTLAEAVKQLEADRLAVNDIHDVKAQKLANEEEEARLKAFKVELKTKEIDLKKYENKLFEIKTMQDKREKEWLDAKEKEKILNGR